MFTVSELEDLDLVIHGWLYDHRHWGWNDANAEEAVDWDRFTKLGQKIVSELQEARGY